jgi:hypothetical protein
VDGGDFCSLAEVDGLAAVAYYNPSSDSLMFDVHKSNPVVVDTELGGSDAFCSLGTVGGLPAIAYHHKDSGELRFVRALDPLGNTWGAPVTVRGDSDNSVGFWCQMCIVQGAPAIAYFEESGKVMFIRASQYDGSAWATAPVQIDNNPALLEASCLSLRIINGKPALAFSNANSELLFARAQDSSGSTWDLPIILGTSFGGVCPRISMAAVGGHPAIVMERSTELYYFRAQDANGTQWVGPSVIDNGGALASLGVCEGLPYIAYYHNFDQTFRILDGTDAEGSDWKLSYPGESQGSLAAGSRSSVSMALVNGHLTLAFFDPGDATVRMLRLEK